MKVIGAEAVRRALPYEALIPALRAGFAAGCDVPLRHHHAVPGEGGGGTLLLMPAWTPGRHLGLKVVTVYPGNAAKGQPALHATYLLGDAATGRPLALIDGEELTVRRTAAASALAASYLARPDADHLLIVGAGRVAGQIAQAYRAVRPIRRVAVWSRDPARAGRLAAALEADGFDARAEASLEPAVNAAAIVSCATLSTAPLVHGRWLRPGTHLDLIGGFTPAMREADDGAIARARVYVDTEAALAEAGDLTGPIAAGRFAPEGVVATLADLCRGEVAGRGSAGEITVFKSVGTALEDLVAATLVHEAEAARSFTPDPLQDSTGRASAGPETPPCAPS